MLLLSSIAETMPRVANLQVQQQGDQSSGQIKRLQKGHYSDFLKYLTCDLGWNTLGATKFDNINIGRPYVKNLKDGERNIDYFGSDSFRQILHNSPEKFQNIIVSFYEYKESKWVRSNQKRRIPSTDSVTDTPKKKKRGRPRKSKLPVQVAKVTPEKRAEETSEAESDDNNEDSQSDGDTDGESDDEYRPSPPTTPDNGRSKPRSNPRRSTNSLQRSNVSSKITELVNYREGSRKKPSKVGEQDVENNGSHYPQQQLNQHQRAQRINAEQHGTGQRTRIVQAPLSSKVVKIIQRRSYVPQQTEQQTVQPQQEQEQQDQQQQEQEQQTEQPQQTEQQTEQPQQEEDQQQQTEQPQQEEDQQQQEQQLGKLQMFWESVKLHVFDNTKEELTQIIKKDEEAKSYLARHQSFCDAVRLVYKDAGKDIKQNFDGTINAMEQALKDVAKHKESAEKELSVRRKLFKKSMEEMRDFCQLQINVIDQLDGEKSRPET